MPVLEKQPPVRDFDDLVDWVQRKFRYDKRKSRYVAEWIVLRGDESTGVDPTVQLDFVNLTWDQFYNMTWDELANLQWGDY